MSILPQNGSFGLFSIDPGATPDQIAKKRALIAAMMPQYGKARYVGEGIGQLATGIATGMANRKMDKFEADKRAEASEAYRNLVGGGPLSVLGMKDDWGTTFAAEEAPPADPMSPDAIGRDAMAAIGGGGGTEWLSYANQNATRNKPINERLISALSFLPELGVEMKVVSGGQDAKGQGNRRTGSERHDHGNAADVDFYMGGRRLDWNNPDDAPIFSEIVKRARASGVTGIGAGDDYMGAGRMHVGFGPEAVWGAGGKGENAPDWLRQAYGGQSRVGTGPQVAYNGPSVAELSSALSNPWLSQEERGVVGMMLQQAQQANDPMRAMEMERAQLELDQLRNPQVKPININGKLVDPNTYEVIADFSEGPEPTSAMQEYDAAVAQGYTGTLQDWILSQRKASAPNQTMIVGADGTIPPDEAELRKKLGGKEGESWSAMLDAGTASSGTMQDIQMLDQLIEIAPQGPLQGRMAEMFPGFDSSASAFNSVVKRIAPTLRAPGSGSTSDIEYDGMLKSIPQLSARPEANRAIAGMMRAKAEINIARASVIRSYQNGEISAVDARKALTEIDGRSIMTPELKALIDGTAPETGGETLSDDDMKWMQ